LPPGESVLIPLGHVGMRHALFIWSQIKEELAQWHGYF
jgi:hypothetical protein